MKVMIVFLALVLLCVPILAFSTDMNRYQRMQAALKSLAENCAHAGALCVDAQALSKGDLKIDAQAAGEYVRLLLSRPVASELSGGRIRADIAADGPVCTVRLDYDGPDIFRLPFLEVTHITRSSAYEWK